MAFTVTTLAKGAFKKAFGKAHTSNNKEIGNESIPSTLALGTKDIFGQAISSSPSSAVSQGVAVQCTGFNALSLALDNTSTGKAYFAVVPSSASHPLKSVTNPTTGKKYQTGDRVTRIIPQSFGDDYRPIIKKGSTEVTPFASENWVFDTVAGVLTSEADLNLGSTGAVECYVFVGQMLSESIGKQGAIALSAGAKSVTVVFDEPFDDVPGLVQVQWCFSPNLTSTGVIPTITVDQINREGFVARWSHAVGSGYIIRWEAAVLAGDGVEEAQVKAYISPSDYGAQILAIPLDVLTSAVSPAAMSYAASFVQGHSSKTHAYFAGGVFEGSYRSSIEKFSYASETVASISNTLPAGRARGASVGFRSKGFIAGGSTLSNPTDLAIVSLSSTTDTAQSMAISLPSSSVSRGTSNDYASGYIALDSGGTSLIDFLLETLSTGPSLVTDTCAGCNDTGSGVGYFSQVASPNVTTLNYSTGTVGTLATSLAASTQGRSCAFNSIAQGYFVGSDGADQIDFSTGTITAVGLSLTSVAPGECTAVQSQGLL